MANNTEPNWDMVGKRVFKRFFPLWLILWILFVLYPNPTNLAISIKRVLSFDVDPNAVGSITEDLSSDPRAIEKEIIKMIPYRYDWEVYGMPWYFPTVEEVLKKGEGDCKSRAIVLASIFEIKNIPYQIDSSPIHIWVEYEGKEKTSVSNERVVFYQQDPETGERSFRIPDISPKEVIDSFFHSFLVPMPWERKAILIVGLLVLIAVRLALPKRLTS